MNERWDICYYAYWAVLFSSFILCAVSLLTLTAISVDRLFALRLGLRYRQVVTFRRTCITVTGFWILSIVCASTLFFNRRIASWCLYIVSALCLVTTIFAYAKIFVTLRHNQIHVQSHAAQGQPSQAIPLNIARYRKAVYSALWVQGTLVICYLPYSCSFETSERDVFIPLPCSAIYGYFSVFELIIKPVVVLLEDQRSEASCKRNIKATFLSIELVFYALHMLIRALIFCS